MKKDYLGHHLQTTARCQLHPVVLRPLAYRSATSDTGRQPTRPVPAVEGPEPDNADWADDVGLAAAAAWPGVNLTLPKRARSVTHRQHLPGDAPGQRLRAPSPFKNAKIKPAVRHAPWPTPPHSGGQPGTPRSPPLIRSPSKSSRSALSVEHTDQLQRAQLIEERLPRTPPTNHRALSAASGCSTTHFPLSPHSPTCRYRVRWRALFGSPARLVARRPDGT